MSTKEKIKNLSNPLPIESIDFRIQSINKGGYATILAYKDARVDMQVLNREIGALNWKREHTRDNKNCIVSIWDEEKKLWVSKEDTGTESNSDAEKGLASDSFKRACFNWGIGIEIYDYPVIQIKLFENEWKLVEHNGKQYPKSTFDLKLKEWRWKSQFDENGKLTYLGAIDNNKKVRFQFGKLEK